MLTALLGGTFNPIHRGHTHAALAAADALGIAEVRMLLSARPTHRDDVHVSIEDRWQMLELACADEPRLSPDATEIERQEPSYTVTTLERLHSKHPGILPSWILGHDAFQLLYEWFQWQRLMSLANLIVLRRPGMEVGLAPQMQEFVDTYAVDTLAPDRVGQMVWLELELLAISATDIRQGIRRGDAVAHLLHEPVYAYIRAHNLYESTDAHATQFKSRINMEDAH